MSVPKQVAFGEEGKVVVGGSDNGLVYVFDRKTGDIIETLHHADTDTGLVQTISTRDLHGRCTIASTSTALGRGKTTIKIWVYDYAVQKVSKAPSGNYWSLSRILMMLTQILALLSTSIFLLVNYNRSFLDNAVNHVQGYMTSATVVNVADDFSRRVKAAMIFDDYVDIGKETKLMELAQEAGREIDEDEHRDENKGNTDPQAAKGDEQTMDLFLVQ
ncbi:hypothetical protein EV424DRAFT_1536998 [Suillus variegatus]|nr:hypothetical protein EV424DRAFT_1536998 [Suillus variegatus]